MKRTYDILITAIAAVLLGGCAAELEDPEAADDGAVLDHVEALGFNPQEAKVIGDHVVVEGDIVFERQGLLRGEYEQFDAPEDSDLVEKGYRYPGLIAEKHRGNLRILFASGAYAPSNEMRAAFLAAAKAWSEVPGSSIRISPDNTGPAIVVRKVPVKNWAEYSGCEDADACAYAPKNGRPGYDLFVREKSFDKGCTTWSPTGLAYLARHELGHAIGFAHPKTAGSKHVSGTQKCSKANEAQCLKKNDYDTVMGAAVLKSSCVYSPARITKDDYATCTAVYPVK